MAAFNSRRFRSLVEWLWRRLLFLWRSFPQVIYSVVGYTRTALTWLKGSRDRRDDGPEGPAERDCEAAASGRERGPEGWETDPRSKYESLIMTENANNGNYH